MNILFIIISIISIVIILSFIYFSRLTRPTRTLVSFIFFTLSISVMIIAFFTIKNKELKNSISIVLCVLMVFLVLFFWYIFLRNKCSSNYTPSYDYYCGDNNIPAPYQRRGTSSECLRKGIGVGRCMRVF